MFECFEPFTVSECGLGSWGPSCSTRPMLAASDSCSSSPKLLHQASNSSVTSTFQAIQQRYSLYAICVKGYILKSSKLERVGMDFRSGGLRMAAVTPEGAHRDCSPGHWYRRDHAEILLREIRKAKKLGLAASLKFVRTLDEGLKKEAGRPKRSSPAARKLRAQ